MTIERRAFGSPPVPLPVLGLGCSKIGSLQNPVPMTQIRRILARSYERGVRVFDTADIYGQGDSERELGRFLRGRREDSFVVTKAGQHFSTAMRVIRPFKPLLKPLFAMRAGTKGAGPSAIDRQRSRHLRTDFSPTHLAEALDASLGRLRLDHVDAFLLHSPAAADLAHPDLPAVLERILRTGKARHVGVSCDDHAALAAALALPDLALVQIAPGVLAQAQASGVTAAMRQRRIGVLLREVMQARKPGQSGGAVVREALAAADVTCVIVGTSSLAHLDDLASGAEVATA